MNINRSRVLIVIGAIWGLFILGVIIFFIYTIGKVKVDVEYAPFAAKVQLNGVTVSNHHNHYIAPGEYQVKVEFENFETYEETITVDQDTEFIFGGLTPANETGRAYMEEHLEEFSSINTYASIVANKAGEKQRKQYPIMEKLPIKDPYYTIGYGFSENGEFNINIKSSISYRQLATTKLLSLLKAGDLNKYGIVFSDLDNPFDGTFKTNVESDPEKFIKKGFSSVDVDFNVYSGTESGNYYYAYLKYFFKDSVNVVFRIVLAKDNGAWQLAGTPYPLLTTRNTPNVPVEILDQVNRL